MHTSPNSLQVLELTFGARPGLQALVGRGIGEASCSSQRFKKLQLKVPCRYFQRDGTKLSVVALEAE